MAKTNLKRSTQKTNNKLGNIDRVEQSDIMSEENIKFLNFKVDPDFHKEYKIFALSHDLTMKQLLERSFYKYKELTK